MMSKARMAIMNMLTEKQQELIDFCADNQPVINNFLRLKREAELLDERLVKVIENEAEQQNKVNE